MATCARIIYLSCLVSAVIGDSICTSKSCPSYEPRYGFPVNRTYQYSFPTPVPIAQKSSEAYPVCLPKIEIKINTNSLLLVTNNGINVVSTPYNTGERVATVTGGPIFNFTYIFDTLGFSADGVPIGTRSADSLDGVGFPGRFFIVFYNQLYGSIENCYNFRDGFLKFSTVFRVSGHVRNPAFDEIERALSRVKLANSSTTMNASRAFPFVFDKFTSNKPYYSYPGCRIINNAQCSYSEIDVFPNYSEVQTISFEQYEIFGQILNKYNQSQYLASPAHELEPRPYVQVRNSEVCVKHSSYL